MRIHYRKKNGGAEIVRCYGKDSRLVIPAGIDGLPVISAAPYAFSDHLDREETDVCIWESGTVNRDAEPLLAGNRLEELILPETLKEIGRYIFYGCGKLRRLEFSDNLMQIGSGAFTGCHAIDHLTIHLTRGTQTCAREVLGELAQRVDLRLIYGEKTENKDAKESEAGSGNTEEDITDGSGEGLMRRQRRRAVALPESRLVFPEHYDEAVENTPARILYTEYHGSGSNYRQCFYDRRLNYPDYDRLFPMAIVMEKTEVLVDMVFDRLQYPVELSEKAGKDYKAYLTKNLPEIASYLVQTEDMSRLEFLSGAGLWTQEGLESGIEAAARQKAADISAFLMNERQKRLPQSPKPGSKRKRFEL